MFQTIPYEGTEEEKYESLLRQLAALIKGEKDFIANLANASALLNQFLRDINWVGFYLWKDDELVLGPFQGLPACIRIPYGKGVCGSAIKQKETLLVPNVEEFPGHIVCDAASKSEIVVPMLKGEKMIGVLDIDSPIYHRFNDRDREYLEKFVDLLIDNIQ